MFRNKLPPLEGPETHGGYDPEFEYQAFAYPGIKGFNEDVNKLARQGWELINACMGGSTHYAYMRRRIRKPD